MISVYSIDAGLLGLALTYALNMMGLFQYSVRQSAEVENQVNHYELIHELRHKHKQLIFDFSNRTTDFIRINHQTFFYVFS